MSKTKKMVVEYRNYHLPYDFPVLLLSGEHWKIGSTPSKRLHFHNCLEIGICHSGSGYMAFSGNSEPLYFQAGDITCIPRNVPHTTYSSPGTESHWSYLFFNPKELFHNYGTLRELDLPLSAFKNYHHILNRQDHPEVSILTTQIIHELKERHPHYYLSASGLLLALCVELYRIQSIGGEGTTRTTQLPENAHILSPVLDYIEDNYDQSFDITYLADICKLSPTHFRRLFHSIMGTGPLDFINSVRITKACNLLRSTESSILEISELVGFRSISSFNRHFLDIMHTTPRTYRNETLTEKLQIEKMSIIEYSGWMYPEKE